MHSAVRGSPHSSAPCVVAVTVASPTPTAVRSPVDWFTVTIFSFDDFQEYVFTLASEGNTVAESEYVSPLSISIYVDEGVMLVTYTPAL